MKSSQLVQRMVDENRGHWLARLAKRLLHSKFSRLQVGAVQIVEGQQSYRFGCLDKDFPELIRIEVLDQAFYPEVVFGGSIGAGESYMRGAWKCSQLTELVRLMLRNRNVLDAVDSGAGQLLKPLNKLFHCMQRNTLSGSRRNIAAHYDLGNDMFAAFLDETMTYSCGIFEDENATMYDASVAKLDRVCRKLKLSSEDHLLEIGTGWGSMAIHAASHYGCRVTTTTISGKQHQLAVQRIEAAGLSDRITVLLKDYRELEGEYDKLVSIEMIEAIGYRNYPQYFRKCARLLKPEGAMLLQTITIADQRFDQAAKSVDFIQRYIFPGSCIPSVAAMTDAIAKHSDLRLYNLEDIGPHYATTLAHWRDQFFANIDQIRAQGYPCEFELMWEFYLCYCEGGFLERALGDVQMLLVKPLNRQSPLITAN
ncbi:cyclopropane-fatty-acyl-phospholipid synthase family protein [Porticoccaceae bacterium LTM1]|nr:cyclopropane-fatty-acyl-phospholipid synthase family protein [Porticoccaceae bacterium LTM1]